MPAGRNGGSFGIPANKFPAVAVRISIFQTAPERESKGERDRMNKEREQGLSAEPEKRRGQEVYEWMQAVVCSVLAVVMVFTFGVRLIGVDGRSMVPTLQNGDRLLVLNAPLCGTYRRGDIVIAAKSAFENGEAIVKRVVATEGQVVDIDFDAGKVYVDGEALREDYINEPTYREEGMTFPLTVPEGSVFLMGDNRNHSSDSRDPQLGTVDVRCLIGKAVFLLFPGMDETEKRDYGRIGGIG